MSHSFLPRWPGATGCHTQRSAHVRRFNTWTEPGVASPRRAGDEKPIEPTEHRHDHPRAGDDARAAAEGAVDDGAAEAARLHPLHGRSRVPGRPEPPDLVGASPAAARV